MHEHGSSLWVAVTILGLTSPFAFISGPSQGPAKPIPKVTDAEYEVYSAYIAEAFTGAEAEDRVVRRVLNIVIVNRTESDLEDPVMVDDDDKPIPWTQIIKYLRKKEPTLQVGTLRSFRAVNAEPTSLRPSFHLPVPYQLVEKARIDTIFEKNGWWPDFYKKFPGSQGFLVLSRVGFSADGNQALLYATNRCGGKCASGTYVVMEKRNAKWKIAKEICVWVS